MSSSFGHKVGRCYAAFFFVLSVAIIWAIADDWSMIARGIVFFSLPLAIAVLWHGISEALSDDD